MGSSSDRVMPSRFSRARRLARICLFSSRIALSISPLDGCSPGGGSLGTASTFRNERAAALFSAIIAGSPSLWLMKRFTPVCSTILAKNLVPYSVTPFAGSAVAEIRLDLEN